MIDYVLIFFSNFPFNLQIQRIIIYIYIYILQNIILLIFMVEDFRFIVSIKTLKKKA